MKIATKLMRLTSAIWLPRETLSNRHIFSHTLLFTRLLLGAGLYLYLTRPTGWRTLLGLGYPSPPHSRRDVAYPSAFLRPLHGLSFEKMAVEGWLPKILNSLVTELTVYLPELIGAILLAVFFWELIHHGKLTSFHRSGRVDLGSSATGKNR